MIYDKIENISLYRGISKYLPYAVDFLEKTDLTQLPLGRTEICEDHVFINVMEAETIEETDSNFEFHKRYWDIQMDISGSEKFQVGTGEKSIVKELDSNTDYGTFTCEDHVEVVLREGYFVLCMNNEPHKPTLQNGGKKKIKKCVIKVEADN